MGNGSAARHLYLESAKIYEEQADAVFGTSIREALWLLQEAHDHFMIAGDSQRAAQVYEQCASLAKKSNPFVTSESLDQVLRIRRSAGAAPKPAAYSTPIPQTSEASDAVKEFLRLREGQPSKVAPQVRAPRTIRRPSIEKSIVS
jgi:hypothetical protein